MCGHYVRGVRTVLATDKAEMNPWIFQLLKLIWGEIGPSDILLIGTYAGTPMQKTLPLRKHFVCWVVGKYGKDFTKA